MALELQLTTERYTYDENGNRLTADFNYAQSPISATYDLQDRMETYGNNTYTYTLNGSLLTKSNAEGTTKYSYDAMGNLLRIKLPDTRVITYQIDARGRRVGKKVNGSFQYGFIYSTQLNPIAKVDVNGNILEQYIYGMKSNVPEYIIKGNKNYKIISNHLGSPVMVVDLSDNSVVKNMKYDSFGNILEDSAPDFELPFRFAGGIWDKDTKLVRFGVRELQSNLRSSYDTETGRWTSKEPLGFAGARKFGTQISTKGYTTNQQSCNFYVYAKNNPIMLWDLTGLKPGDCFNTPYKAAIDALKYIYDESMLKNKEIGGWINKGSNRCYYATEPILGTMMETDLGFHSFNTVAFYHSHSIWVNNTSLLFSDGDGDLGFALARSIDAYLINVIGDISWYDNFHTETTKIGQFGDPYSMNHLGSRDKFYDRTATSFGKDIYYDK